jgi:methionyl-tRNA formyltransferase
MRLLFFGTPDFALPSLEALRGSRHEVVGVVCQPDRPVRRGRRMDTPPVGRICRETGLRLHQPEKLEREPVRALFRESGAEAGVVVAYGKILKPWCLDLAPRGFINVHASLLPKYRGAAPIARAVIDGEKETGVSIMALDEGMDTGPVYAARACPIGPDETAGELSARLAALGAETLVETLDAMEAGGLEPRPQEGTPSEPRPQEGTPSMAPPLEKSDGRLRWDRTAREIHDQVRGVNPWPGGTAGFRDGEVRIWRTALAEAAEGGQAGEVVVARKGILRVAAGAGSLELVELQLPGKKKVGARDFLNGTRLKPGEMFS